MYGQLINLLNKKEIFKFSREYNGERYVKRFDAYQHMAIMLYAVIRRFDSLREISDYMFPESRKLAHLGISTMLRRSTWSDANAHRSKRCLRRLAAACIPASRANFPRTAIFIIIISFA